MTCIAAIRTTNSILMGGDSAATHAEPSISIVANGKVCVNGDYLFGVTGHPGLLERLQYWSNPPTETDDTSWDEFMIRIFRPMVFSIIASEIPKGSTVLIGTRGGGIYTLHPDKLLSQSHEPFMAIGSGEKWALGSLYSTSGNPQRRLLKAVKAAAYFSPFVRSPFVIVGLTTSGNNGSKAK